MNRLLLVEATEELQPLAEELERADFRVSACAATEASDRLSSDGPVDVLLINLMERAADAMVRDLLQAEALPPLTVTIAILQRRQLADLDPELPLDDFVVYPAPPEELTARIRRALWCRHGPGSSHVLRRGDLIIDQANYKVFVAGRPAQLTYKEYELLRFLALNQDIVCTRETLLNRVWGYDFYGGGRTVDVHIRRLRSKIEDRAHTFIETVRNVGYRFRAG